MSIFSRLSGNSPCSQRPNSSRRRAAALAGAGAAISASFASLAARHGGHVHGPAFWEGLGIGGGITVGLGLLAIRRGRR
jgi:hypothetical protein